MSSDSRVRRLPRRAADAANACDEAPSLHAASSRRDLVNGHRGSRTEPRVSAAGIVLLRSDRAEIRSRARAGQGDVHRLAQAERELALVEEELARAQAVDRHDWREAAGLGAASGSRRHTPRRRRAGPVAGAGSPRGGGVACVRRGRRRLGVAGAPRGHGAAGAGRGRGPRSGRSCGRRRRPRACAFAAWVGRHRRGVRHRGAGGGYAARCSGVIRSSSVLTKCCSTPGYCR